MLSHIHIRNFAIVETLELEFSDGMSALTGETGAGKSILLDALGLCLGERGEADAIRPGADKAEISATFSIEVDSEAAHWLRDNELAVDDECLLRRVIQPNGRSRGFINGTPVPLQLLRELGETLVDIHGQHAHQSLFRRDAQREALDGFGGHDAPLSEVARLYQRLVDIEAEARKLDGQGDYEQRMELLRFQVDELSALNLTPESIAELDAEQRRLAAAGDLIQTAQRVLGGLYEDEGSVQNVLGHAVTDLERLVRIDPSLAEAHELLTSALIQMEEGCDSLRRYADTLELDPERLEWVEQRIGLLTDLARKHRVRAEELPDRLVALSNELAQLEGAEERLVVLQQELKEADRAYRAAAAVLSTARQQAATALAARVTSFIHELGMPGAEFVVEVTLSQDGKPTRHGLDNIEFLVRTNPGQPIGPLNRIASGGELSRIGLAIQVATAKTGRIQTLIFDEADVGIGGAIAEVVGRQLRQLGADRQVLCVTHLPQVAAQAHHHYQVSKYTKAGHTFTQVRWLEPEERIEEIARMLGGVEITPQTRSHAQEMLDRARDKKSASA
ncbi:MAG TPA: DNA repair protein RecN [Gammaproteobacteria bacterium]|nr:DNA repair protein RecN [Gammaproteobacteria bacterium]